MALLWIDGFEQYATVADIKDAYDGQLIAFSVQTGRNTGGGNNRSIEMDFNADQLIKNIVETTSTIVVGVAFNYLTALSLIDLMRWYSGGTEMITIRPEAGGELAIDRGSTEIAVTSGLGLLAAQWYYLELKVFIHDSTGTVELWIDGNKVINETALDTKNGTPNTINRVWLLGNTGDMNFDDFYILDDSGTDATDRLGDSRVETVVPDADGATNNFTPVGAGTTNADRVDDGLTPDDDTTYVHSSTATDKDLYGFEALAGSIDTVFGVQVTLYARKEETGERTVRTVARSGTTEVESGDFYLGPQYRYVSNMYENDPNGGGNWNEAAVNAAQFGIKIQA